MLEILDQRKVTNTFHVYHEESFGLFRGDGALEISNVNKPLMDLFIRHFAKKEIDKHPLQ